MSDKRNYLPGHTPTAEEYAIQREVSKKLLRDNERNASLGHNQSRISNSGAKHTKKKGMNIKGGEPHFIGKQHWNPPTKPNQRKQRRQLRQS